MYCAECNFHAVTRPTTATTTKVPTRTYLLLADDRDWPGDFVWALDGDPGEDCGAEDVVEVVGDAADQAAHAHQEDEGPAQLPAEAVRQAEVVEAVGGGPQVEACMAGQ